MLVLRLTEAIAAVCPVDGVSIGRLDDKATWRIEFSPEANDAQKSAALEVLASFDGLAADPETVLPQDMMALLTPDDMTKIMTAISGNAQMALLWYSMVAQRDPMLVANVRFQAGWGALMQVLGAARMAEIASALGITV